MLTSYFQLRYWYCVGCKRARGGCEKDMLSCQSPSLRFQFPSQLEPSKPMRQVRKYRHGMGNQPSTQLNFEWPGNCNASRASAVASYNRMPAPTQTLGKEKPGIRVSRSRWEFSSPVREVKYLLLPLDYQHHARLKLDAEPHPPVTTNPTLWKDTFNRRSGTHARISQKVVRSPSASPLLNSSVCARAFSDGDPTICKSRQMI